VREPKYQIRETDCGWVVYRRVEHMWVSMNAGPWSAREDAEAALRDYLDRELKKEEKERARRLSATYYDDLGVRTCFAGAGAMGAQPIEWR
jgi:hypothetical protein